MKKPNFLVAGFPKCGTTSLYEYLKIHPEVFLPEKKELNYFTHDYLVKATKGPNDDRIFKNNLITTKSEYFNQFTGVSNEIAIGDCSPSYASFPESIPKIIDHLGETVKIIIIVRNPIDRAYSNYSHLVRQGRESLDFKEAILAEDDRLNYGYSDFWGYKWNSIYFEKIKSFKEKFSNVKVITFENFINDKNEFYSLLNFLELNTEYDSDFLNNRFNEGANYKSNLLVNTLVSDNQLKRFIVNNSPNWSRKYLLKAKRSVLDRNKTSKNTISNNDREFLKQFFVEDVKKLTLELDIDTSLWTDFN